MILPKNDNTFVNKICTINQLSIPNELLDIIKEYLFYDASASIIIQHIRSKKSELCSLIKNAINLEDITNMNVPGEWIFIIDVHNNQNGIYPEYENEEYWPLSITYEFGANNCQICGDYIKPPLHSYCPSGISPQNTCKCII
jgi:hypothetical protein